MQRSQYRPPLPRFRPPSVMSDPQEHQVYSLDHRRDAHETQQEVYVERPSLVISGSRKFNQSTLGPRSNLDSHADRIVARLEENQDLMEDTPLSEELRKEALRDLPQNLTMKRCVKTKLTKSVSQKSKHRPIGFWKRLKYRININFSKFVASLRNFNYFELWHGRLKDIEGHFGSGYASYFKFLRWLFVMNCVIALVSFVFLVLPQIIADTSPSNPNTQDFYFKHLFIGTGYFTETVLYYGHYTDSTIEVIPHIFYGMPAAYFSVTVILYLLAFIILAVSVAQSYRRNFIETEGGLQNVYANRIFCGWDYGIATKEAAELKSSSIYNELKELLSEDYKEPEVLTCMLRFQTYVIQVVVNVFVLVILGAVGWVTWILLVKFFDEGGPDSVVAIAIVANLVIMAFPTVFNYISKYEDYSNPRTSVYITLARTYLLGCVFIGVILAFWLRKAEKYNCWETALASEIYRLTIFDFLISVVGTFLIDAGYFTGRYFLKRNPKSEFNVAKHTLQIIYNQGLFWVGFFYSPILPIIVTIKMFVIWYVIEFSVRKFCRPPKRTWRAAQAQTLFMVMTFVGLLLIIAVQGYTLNSIPSSSICGPFKGYNYTYEILTNNIGNLEEDPFWGVVMNITKPGGVTLIIIALIILVYYLREQALATREKVKMLKKTMVWIAKDKKYLVDLYNQATKGVANTRSPWSQLVHRPDERADFGEASGLVSKEEFSSRFKSFS